MDILSHGLYGGAAFGRKSKPKYWLAFFFGIAPDLFSFGIFSASVWFGFAHGLEWRMGPPDPSLIPQYVHQLYNITHSFITFTLAFFLVWALLKRPAWEMLAWGLHVAMDIFTHSDKFFPTPFLWPISDYTFNGVSWSQPAIFFPNVALLALVYGYWWYSRRMRSA